MWNGINLTLNYFNSPPLPPHTLPSPLVLYKTEKKQIKVKVQNDFYGDLWPFNAKCPKMVRHRPATYLKRNSGAARFSKCVWSFWNFMHSRAKSLWHHCLGTVNWSEKKNWNQPLWNSLRKHWFHKLGFTKWDTTAHTCQVKVSTKYFRCPLWIILNRNE